MELQPMLGRIGCPKNDTLRTIDEATLKKTCWWLFLAVLAITSWW